MIRPYFKNDILAAKRRRQKWAETEKKTARGCEYFRWRASFLQRWGALHADLDRVLYGLLFWFHFFILYLLFEEGNCMFRYLSVFIAVIIVLFCGSYENFDGYELFISSKLKIHSLIVDLKFDTFF